MIPANISREHVVQAIMQVKRNGVPKGRGSRKFRLFYEGECYPPKYVISLANTFANGYELDSSRFSGGHETNSFLTRLGFVIHQRTEKRILGPVLRDVLLKIYIGQNIREQGILRREIHEEEQVQILLSKRLIEENDWYRLDQLRTTDTGSDVGKILIKERIEKYKEQVRLAFQNIPARVLGFFVRRFISEQLVFLARKPSYRSEFWRDRVLTHRSIWALWKEVFGLLKSVGLCVETPYYVATRGGITRDRHYVISQETQEFLIDEYSTSDFDLKQQEMLDLYTVLLKASIIMFDDNADRARAGFSDLLRDYSIEEVTLASFIGNMKKKQITSEYRGLLSGEKPFEIVDLTGFKIYLDKEIIDPAVGFLLGGEWRKGETASFLIQPSAEEEEVNSLSSEIINLLSDCNNISSSKSREKPFKITNKMLRRVAELNRVAKSRDEFGDYIDALYEIIYEGSGGLKRLPESLRVDDSVVFVIKHIRNEFRHDLEHGEEKDVSKRGKRLTKIYRKHTGKTSVSSLATEDFTKFQLDILRELRSLLLKLKQYCISA